MTAMVGLRPLDADVSHPTTLYRRDQTSHGGKKFWRKLRRVADG